MIDDLVLKSDMMRTSMGLPMKDMVEDTTGTVYDANEECSTGLK